MKFLYKRKLLKKIFKDWKEQPFYCKSITVIPNPKFELFTLWKIITDQEYHNFEENCYYSDDMNYLI